jgi:hypothetical protein
MQIEAQFPEAAHTDDDRAALVARVQHEFKDGDRRISANISADPEGPDVRFRITGFNRFHEPAITQETITALIRGAGFRVLNGSEHC